jgi:nicotinamidase-related amidase
MKKVIVLSLLVVACIGIIQGQTGDNASKRMRPALLVIDIQNEFLPMVSEREKEIGMYMINGMIDMFREQGFPVIRVYHTTPGEGPEPGTPAFEFPESVKILPTDPKVIKNYANGFNKTDLGKSIREKGCNTVFMCGLSSVGCVLATYMGAKDLDLESFMIKDAIMSHNSEYTDAIEEIFGAVSYDVVQVMLRNAEK